jgi:ABC-type glutathione transport system ATPase component
MGRPERPIDPDAGPVAEFASELRKLRDKAGRPSYRELARRASFSVTVLSEAAGGRALPTLAVVKGYVRACGGDACEWEERWRRAAGQWREAAEGAARPAPYRGLASYGAEHAGLFFGREALTRDLLQRVCAGRFIAVFGPSGSGKSSLLRAGLLAAVSRGGSQRDRALGSYPAHAW